MLNSEISVPNKIHLWKKCTHYGTAQKITRALHTPSTTVLGDSLTALSFAVGKNSSTHTPIICWWTKACRITFHTLNSTTKMWICNTVPVLITFNRLVTQECIMWETTTDTRTCVLVLNKASVSPPWMKAGTRPEECKQWLSSVQTVWTGQSFLHIWLSTHALNLLRVYIATQTQKLPPPTVQMSCPRVNT